MDDPTKAHIDVYDTKEGLWNREVGELELPEGWDYYLPAGDAFVTRRVKAAGDYWMTSAATTGSTGKPRPRPTRTSTRSSTHIARADIVGDAPHMHPA